MTSSNVANENMSMLLQHRHVHQRVLAFNRSDAIQYLLISDTSTDW